MSDWRWTLVMQDVAASAMDEPGFAGWIRLHVKARSG